ncbi:AAA family ATPase [Amycolatopsis sp. 195334CR]|uniref:AAA family ATPase n=1 Tax=Amycolatopsis sp. 195334CR TaxID=2814588 RepID=UPI001F5E064E|nr:AAA family ATPase [Amycolatopsis sp. 195334CR]
MDNVKGFHDERVVDLDLRRPDGNYAGWTVLAGRNGSGKTSLLRGIALAIGGPAVARNLVSDFDNWMSAGAEHAVAEVTLAYEPGADRFTSGRPPAKTFSAGLSWTAPNEAHVGRRPAQPSLSGYFFGKSGGPARRGPWQDNPVGWFCAAYGPFRRLVGGTSDSQRLMLTAGPVGRMASLFHEDASLAEGVSWLIEQHLRSLEDRPGAMNLKQAALWILQDGLLPDGYRITKVDSEGLWVEHRGHEFPLREMSDGYRTVVALVTDLLKQLNDAFGDLPVGYDGDHPAIFTPGVVIIDEVDAHLHVSWQKRIGTWLKRHFPAIQFIVTTHSPYVCQAADPGGLITMPAPNERKPPRPVETDLWERVVYGTGDDAVLSELFGLDTAYSDQAQELRKELVELEVAVLSGDASRGQRIRYGMLKDLLTSSPVTRVREIDTSVQRSTGA